MSRPKPRRRPPPSPPKPGKHDPALPQTAEELEALRAELQARAARLRGPPPPPWN